MGPVMKVSAQIRKDQELAQIVHELIIIIYSIQHRLATKVQLTQVILHDTSE